MVLHPHEHVTETPTAQAQPTQHVPQTGHDRPLQRPRHDTRHDTVPTVIVTTAALSGTEDRRLRERRYLLTQLCRVVCFVLSVALPVALPVRLVFIVGAFVLPWMGVVAANAGPAKEKARLTNVVDRGSVDETWDEPLRITYDASTTIDQD